jgi:hypothetical protein
VYTVRSQYQHPDAINMRSMALVVYGNSDELRSDSLMESFSGPQGLRLVFTCRFLRGSASIICGQVSVRRIERGPKFELSAHRILDSGGSTSKSEDVVVLAETGLSSPCQRLSRRHAVLKHAYDAWLELSRSKRQYRWTERNSQLCFEAQTLKLQLKWRW